MIPRVDSKKETRLSPAEGFVPEAWRLPVEITVEQAFRQLAPLPYCLLLESTLRHPELGRYSFLMADPFEVVTIPGGHGVHAGTQFEALQQRLKPFAASTLPGLPPFQGGAAGVLGYELGDAFESLPAPEHDEFTFPRLCVGLYDIILAFDHVTGHAWCISHGFPEMDPERRRHRAHARRSELLHRLDGPPAETQRAMKRQPIVPSARHFPVRTKLHSNFTEAGYCEAVQGVVDYILAGDVFQVNLSQRLLTRYDHSALTLYERLRTTTRAPFAGYFDLGDSQIVSVSPERFVQVQDGEVEARPIKGTRRGLARPVADLFARSDLSASEKDRAENTMIVDLMRNDLSRVCTADSIAVPQLCGLESYGYVHHLVSVIRGKLKVGNGPLDLIRTAFPGGSVTGAPKIRAMQIIQELEQVARGPYCGSLGYIGFNGAADLNILIRTLTLGGGWLRMPVGGGIIATSDPADELEETWHKAAGMLQAIG